MAMQAIKMDYNGSVDFVSGQVNLPGPTAPAQNPPVRKAGNRLSSLRMAIAGLPMAVLSMTVPALATTYSLNDGGNTTIQLNPNTGLTSWTVNSIQQLNIQNFYYRIGSTGGQSLLSASDAPTVQQLANDNVLVTYVAPSFNATVDYLLADGSAKADPSTLNETVTITNTSGGSEAIHFFDYTDFNLNGETSPQSVTISGAPKPNTADQYDSKQTTNADVVGQAASIAPTDVQASIGSALYSAISSNTVPETLNNTLTANGGDANFAFQFDDTLAATGNGSSFLVSLPSTIQPVPEPASLGVIAISGLLLLARRRKAGH